MSVAARFPLLGFAAGLALLVVGLSTGNRALWIVGIVLIVLAAARKVRQ